MTRYDLDARDLEIFVTWCFSVCVMAQKFGLANPGTWKRLNYWTAPVGLTVRNRFHHWGTRSEQVNKITGFNDPFVDQRKVDESLVVRLSWSISAATQCRLPLNPHCCISAAVSQQTTNGDGVTEWHFDYFDLPASQLPLKPMYYG